MSGIYIYASVECARMVSMKTLSATFVVLVRMTAALTHSERAQQIGELTSYVTTNGHQMDEADVTRVLEGLVPIMEDVDFADEGDADVYVEALERLALAAEATMRRLGTVSGVGS